MKKLFATLILLTGTLFGYPQHSSELSGPLNTLYRLPETKALIEKVESSGAISIKAAKLGSGASNAAWMPDQRTIYINFSKPRSQGSLICSLIFELQNALNQKKFDQVDGMAMKRQISRQKYIEEVERIEYEHAIQTAKLVNKGVQAKIFPADTYWPIAPNFEEHFRVQIEAGHSNLIGILYDGLSGGHIKQNGSFKREARRA